jgi:hypothetical protein
LLIDETAGGVVSICPEQGVTHLIISKVKRTLLLEIGSGF